ncbi:MAG: hypothetical protein KA004_07925 [Verrucomicrobiales bacterium]|nr:hypothetical protein [Verrucomicrobiales bacterium]
MMHDPLKWRRRLVLLVYNLLLPFVLLVLLPGSILKMRRRGGYGRNFWQRLGFLGRQLPVTGGPRPFWLHAVSVGEVNVARKLIREILRREPERRIVLSTTTSTGHAVAVRDAPPQVTVIYSPVDFLPVASRVLRRLQPEKIILVEAEVWPNLTALAKRRGIPLLLANARLSPRSERRYRRFRWAASTIFSLLDRVLVQFPEDAARWQGIGVRPGAVILTGSVKYDEPATKTERAVEFRAMLEALWGTPPPPMFLGASTFPGEEELLGKTLLELRSEFPQLKAVLVPRHFERSPEVKLQLENLGLGVQLRTVSPLQPGADVLLVNTTGELRDWQQIPDVVVIGKSILSTGGQNPVEAIAAGTPVIAGPHMENFSAVMHLLDDAGAITWLADAAGLAEALRGMLRDPDQSRAAALRGRAALEPHRGAARRCAEIVRQFPNDPNG